MHKLWKIARIVKGNKKDFKSNALTAAIAEKQAKADYKKEKKSKKSLN